MKMKLWLVSVVTAAFSVSLMANPPVEEKKVIEIEEEIIVEHSDESDEMDDAVEIVDEAEEHDEMMETEAEVDLDVELEEDDQDSDDEDK